MLYLVCIVKSATELRVFIDIFLNGKSCLNVNRKMFEDFFLDFWYYTKRMWVSYGLNKTDIIFELKMWIEVNKKNKFPSYWKVLLFGINDCILYVMHNLKDVAAATFMATGMWVSIATIVSYLYTFCYSNNNSWVFYQCNKYIRDGFRYGSGYNYWIFDV